MDLYAFDAAAAPATGFLAGVDEAGRGPWAGPVVAAAAILKPGARIPFLNDSKKLSPSRRESIFAILPRHCVAYGIGIVSSGDIDRDGILQATFEAMRRALSGLGSQPALVLVDGNLAVPRVALSQRAVVGGDGLSAAIAAASVFAKVTRDRLMCDYAREYPVYGFDRHKGYGTAEHQAALSSAGPCAIHRMSFAPVRAAAERSVIR